MTAQLAPRHSPVLVQEVLAGLQVRPGGRYVDCTLGEGGHALAILRASPPGGRLLGIDRDPQAVQRARARLQDYGSAALLVNQNYCHLASLCHRFEFLPLDGVLFDLGLSSLQLEEPGRGFSFQREAPLDMRFHQGQDVTAAEIVNTWAEADLAHLLEIYGEEHRARQIARRIVQRRPLTTTLDLAQTVRMAVGGYRGHIHPATRTFMALRLAVNRELESLEAALAQAPRLLRKGGRLVVISYHSLEDRLVKQFFRQASDLRPVVKGVIRPAAEEVAANPRSRSAKMRMAERL